MEKNDEFQTSIATISNEMNTWCDDKKANFGFITNGEGSFRVFCGGNTENIIKGIALAIVNVMHAIGDDYEFLGDIVSKTTELLAKKQEIDDLHIDVHE